MRAPPAIRVGRVRPWTGPAALVGALLALGAPAPAAGAAPERDVLVAAARGAVLPSGARTVAHLGGLRFAVVRAPAGVSTRAYALRLAGRRGVAGAQPNTPVGPAALSEDCVDRPAAPVTEIPTVAGAADRPVPATTRPIAVLSTGVAADAPELAGRVLPPLDALGDQARLDDDDGHGTLVAGAAAAAGRVTGMSPTSPILPVKVAGSLELVTPEAIVKGLEAAAAKRAVVAVLPSSQPLTQTSVSAVPAVGRAVEAALADGMLTVVPVGNDGKGNQVFPGGLAHVLTAGSASAFGTREAFSNFGPWLDVVTLGRDLVLPAPTAQCASGYAQVTGTSFSAGAVAGAVARVAAARPKLAPQDLYDLMRRSAVVDAGPPAFDADTGFGLVNVGAGLDAKAPAADLPEPNDEVYWLKRNPARFPTRLRRTAASSVKATVGPGKDPQDAVKVALAKNDVLTARVSRTSSAALLALTVWSPGTGSFDMSRPSPPTLLDDTSGFAQVPELSFRATATGTHYVAVFAPDWVPPGQGDSEGTYLTSGPPHVAFTLTLRKRCSSSRTLRVPLDRLRRPGARLSSVTILDDGIRRVRWTRRQVRGRIRLDGFANGRHEVVFRGAFPTRAQTRVTRVIRTRCTLRLAR